MKVVPQTHIHTHILNNPDLDGLTGTMEIWTGPTVFLV